MCESIPSSQQVLSNTPFQKILKQLAGQLWQSKLQETLNDPQLAKHFSTQESMNISTYEQLFEMFVSRELITATNITLLKTVLGNQDQGHALLRAVYEAGFGREGLASDSTCCALDMQNRHSNSWSRTYSSSNKLYRDFKQLLRKIDSQLDMNEDFGALKLLCCSVLSFRQLDGVTNTLDLFNVLRQTQYITIENPEFLYRILHDCGRRDLCDLVDGYVYTCLNKSSTESYSPVLTERRNSYTERGECYQFVRALKHVGDQLGSDDLATMKLLAGTCIPESKLEKAKNVYDFFILLQERGKLSASDLTFMDQLLDDKPHVVQHLYDVGFGCRTSQYSTQAECSSTMNFKRLLKTIGCNLTQENIRELKFLCPDNSGLPASVESGIELLQWLEKRGEIGQMNVHYLMELLEEIGRKDLYMIVSSYNKAVQRRHSLRGEMAANQKQLDDTTSILQTGDKLDPHRSRLTAAARHRSVQLRPAVSVPRQLTESSELLLALSRQSLNHDSELKTRKIVSEELEKRMTLELELKDKQIAELTKKLKTQQILLQELASKLDIHIESL